MQYFVHKLISTFYSTPRFRNRWTREVGPPVCISFQRCSQISEMDPKIIVYHKFWNLLEPGWATYVVGSLIVVFVFLIIWKFKNSDLQILANNSLNFADKIFETISGPTSQIRIPTYKPIFDFIFSFEQYVWDFVHKKNDMAVKYTIGIFFFPRNSTNAFPTLCAYVYTYIYIYTRVLCTQQSEEKKNLFRWWTVNFCVWKTQRAPSNHIVPRLFYIFKSTCGSDPERCDLFIFLFQTRVTRELCITRRYIHVCVCVSKFDAERSEDLISIIIYFRFV